MYGNIVAIHNVLKKNYITKFSISSLFKKIGKDNFEKKLKKQKKKKKKKKKSSILEKKKEENKHVKQ
jgi:hypothetical protein